jgi:large subunit ribosomal protein L17
MITLGRRGDLHARRQATAFLRSKDVVHKLFAEVGPQFAERPGGYTRIVKIGPRFGDAADMVYLELVDSALVFKTRVPRETSEEPAAVEAPAADEVEETEEAAEPEAEAETAEAEAEAHDAAADAEEAEAEEAAAADETDDAEPEPQK